MAIRHHAFSVPATALLLSTILVPASQASSPQAWEEFRREVETSCRAAAAEQLRDAQIVVDPFGSQSYGLALLSGTAVEDGAPHSLICVFDKTARTVEIGGVMALEQTLPALRPDLATAPVAPGAASVAGTPNERLLSPSPLAAAPAPIAAAAVPGGSAAFEGRCDADCTATLDALAEPDREALTGLPAQIGRTVASSDAAALGEATAAVRGAASEVAAAALGAEAPTVSGVGNERVGTGSCTLYYFGYEGEPARTVGTHQCAIGRDEDGTIVVEKTSGERLRAELRPLVGPVSAFVGRTFEAGAALETYDPSNPQDDPASELGNTVGFAARAGDDLVLISSQRRRFAESDSFFWVLAIDRP